jgi:DNA-binding NarL/FixJ family response regulator
MSISVFLADDHAVMRDGLKLLLETQEDIQVVGAAGDGRQAVRLVAQLLPQVAIMDISMPQLNGIEATRQIRGICPETRIIILSMHASSDHVLQALQAGAQGYLLKAGAGIEVVQAVRAVHAGERYLSKKVADQIVNDLLLLSEATTPDGPLAGLSSREREVLQLVAEGYSTAEIAEILPLSVKTVESYRSRIMEKLGLKNLPALIKFAIRHGLTQVT